MKKNIVFSLLFLFAAVSTALAQHAAGANDIARALRGGRVSLHASKELLEANEQSVLDIKLLVTPVVNQQTLETEGMAYPIDLPDGSDPNIPAAYHSSNWKVIEGGGTISSIQGNQCVYSAPSSAPAGKKMTISVDLNPTSNVLPKIVLLITLYFVEDQNAIVVNFPEAGFTNQKFVSQANGGVKAPTMAGVDPRAAGHISPDLQAKMAQAQAAMAQAQQNTGINLSAITSNAMAYFDGKTGITAMKFMKMTMQMDNGRDIRNTRAGSMPGQNICELSFKGIGVGNYPLSDSASGVVFKESPTSPKGCGCGNNRNGQTAEAPCKGYVNITSNENGILKGNFVALMYQLIDKTWMSGYIYGKFTVNNANTQ